MWSVIGSADYLRSISSQYKAGRSGAEGAPVPPASGHADLTNAP